MVLEQFSPLGGSLESLRQNRALLGDQIRSRISAVHADKPIKQPLEVRGGHVPIDRPYKRPRVGSRQAGVEVQVPKKVGLVIAMRPVAIAGPDAECHGRGKAGIARLDIDRSATRAAIARQCGAWEGEL